MAEDQWQELQANLQHDIRRAFDELRQRWAGIWDQEQLRWNAAVNHYQYGRNQEGRWTHEWVSKPTQERVEGMKQAVAGMREANDTRLPWEAYSGYGSYMSGPPPERRGVARSEQFATELAESSRRTLEQRLAEVETWQARYTPNDYQYWDAGEEAKQIRQAMTDPVRREAYVQWVVKGAVETGIEEGYPLRPVYVRELEQQLRREEGLLAPAEQTRVALQERLQEVQQELSMYGSWHNEDAQALQAEKFALEEQLHALGAYGKESKLEGMTPKDVEGLQERFDAVAPQLSVGTRTTMQERLAGLLEEAQRQGLGVTSDQSHTEDQKQRQRY